MKVMFRGGTLLWKGNSNRDRALIKNDTTFSADVHILPGTSGIFLRTLILAAALLFFWGIPGQASAAITSTNIPGQAMPVNQVITVTFDEEIGSVSSPAIELREAVTNNVRNFKTSFSGSTLTIVPFLTETANKMLEYNTSYRLYIDQAAVKNAGGANLLASSVTYNFTTAHNFQTLLQTPGTLGSLITTHAPRGLNILIPKKYMTKFDISYITKAGTTTLNSPLTSVDITVDADVDRIEVTFNGSPSVTAQKLDNVFNAGYQGVMTQTDANGKEVGLDIKFSAYDKDDRLLEERTEKLDPKGKKSVTTNPKKLDGTKTLQDLIVNNGKLFTDILGQYSTSDLSLSIRP